MTPVVERCHEVLRLQTLESYVPDEDFAPSTASEGCDTNSTLSTDAGSCPSSPFSLICTP